LFNVASEICSSSLICLSAELPIGMLTRISLNISVSFLSEHGSLLANEIDARERLCESQSPILIS